MFVFKFVHSFYFSSFFSAPDHVVPPKVIHIIGGRIRVQLTKSSEIMGPLSHYDLIVVPLENATKRPQDFTMEEVRDCFVVLTSKAQFCKTMGFHRK